MPTAPDIAGGHTGVRAVVATGRCLATHRAGGDGRLWTARTLSLFRHRSDVSLHGCARRIQFARVDPYDQPDTVGYGAAGQYDHAQCAGMRSLLGGEL